MSPFELSGPAIAWMQEIAQYDPASEGMHSGGRHEASTSLHRNAAVEPAKAFMHRLSPSEPANCWLHRMGQPYP